MSMRNVGCTGHVVKLSDLFSVINPMAVPLIESKLGDADTEEITKLVNENLPFPGCPPIESVFILGDEDESEDLERGEWYAYFAMEDLYEQIRKPGLVVLQSKGINPERRNWVVWG